MNAVKWFDSDAELQKLRSTPPKAPNPPKVEEEEKEDFSYFSHFSRGEGTKTQISVPHDPLSVVAFSEHEPAPFYGGAKEDESEAARWLRARLAQPQRIADLFSEWCAEVVGRSSQEISVRVDLLNDARWTLGVDAYIGADGRFWWRLPQETEQ